MCGWLLSARAPVFVGLGLDYPSDLERVEEYKGSSKRSAAETYEFGVAVCGVLRIGPGGRLPSHIGEPGVK